MGELFGTDGIRGVANTELTPELAFKVGMAAARVLAAKNGKSPKILVGMDTRRSGTMLEAALVAGITSAGGDAVCAGVIPTPGVAYLTKKYGLDAGAVISASHNPFADNGIKFFGSEGYKFNDETELEIEKLILNPDTLKMPRPSGGGVGVRFEAEEAVDDYVEFLKSLADTDGLSGISVALDCANGATYKAGPVLFFELGANVSVISNEPDGENINLRCGSTHLEALQKQVLEYETDIGIAFDGDGDRCLAVDENGDTVDGDEIMAIIGNYLKEQGMLPHNTITVTVMSNLGFMLMGKEKGISIVQTKVGDRYVLEEMQDKGYMLGGEQSGHILQLNRATTGDGLLTALTLVTIMKKTGKKLSELKRVMEKFPQVLVNASVPNEKKNKCLENSDVINAISALESKFEGQGRVLVRPSGTEPLVRVMIEGRDLSEITREAELLAKMLESIG